MRKTAVLFVLVSLYALSPASIAEQELITLKAPPETDPSVQRTNYLDENVLRESRIRNSSDMAQRGYTISPDESFVGYGVPDSHPLEPLNRIDNLGFSRMSFSNTPFEDSLSGVIAGSPSTKGGKIHELQYVFDFEDLGRVTLLERSYMTSPDISRVQIGKPVGNISVRGQAGTFLVQRNESGDKRKSYIYIAINGKIFHMVALRSYEHGSAEWYKFQDLASYFE